MIKNFFPIVLYYILVIILHPTFDMAGDIILTNFFSQISSIASIVLLILELSLPIIFKWILKKNLHQTLIYCFIIFLLIFVLEVAVYCIIGYHYKEFSTERWNDRKLCYIRELMVDDLRNNYKLKGMTTKEIYNLLGKTENDRCHYQEYISPNSSYHQLCYKINNEYIYFCLSFDEKGVVEGTYKRDSKNSYTYDES